MNLGEIVTVTQIVVKEQQGTLSVPVVKDVAPFTATVVGRGWACSGGNGHPPKQMIEVYEVATSMTKHFRIPVQPVQAVQVTQPVQVAQSVPVSRGRVPVNSLDLFDMVERAMNDRSGKPEFTAYDITQELRAANPTLDLPHNEIRNLVHGIVASSVSPSFEVAGQHPSGATLFRSL